MPRLTSREFTESLAFERLEPDPASETVRLLGLLVTMTANSLRDRTTHPQPFTYDDFVPDPYGPTKSERRAAYAAIMASYEANSKHRKPN